MSDDLGAIHFLGGAAPVVVGPYDVWRLYGLDELWEMVRDEDGVASFTQVGAWHRMAELCSEQADQLQRALDQLMVHWSARPGSAAELFKLQVDKMIGSMRESATVADGTKQPLTDITMELGRAKDEIGVLVTRKTTYEHQEAALSSRAVYPGRGATAVPPTADEVPPEGWRQQLDQQARRIMATTDAQVGVAAARIQPVVPYELMPSIGSKGAPLGQGQGQPAISNWVRPPLIPFIPPVYSSPASGAVMGPITDSDEPDLAGGPMSTTGNPGWPPPVAQTGRDSSLPSAVMPPGGVIGAPRAADPVRNVGNGGTRSSSESPGANAHGTSAGGPLVPPPTRGVGTGPGRGAGGGVVPGGRRRRRSDPADPWSLPQGGPSVLEPAFEPIEHDPGPGVIGIDR